MVGKKEKVDASRVNYQNSQGFDPKGSELSILAPEHPFLITAKHCLSCIECILEWSMEPRCFSIDDEDLEDGLCRSLKEIFFSSP